ncbi:VOC family protein [Xanthobacter sp. KR7-65]|uniref:VOC family protein n=1 Tax=Xanthobacter sp. KR7-65 TaxID=3156612 RepID=UPI0032B567B9
MADIPASKITPCLWFNGEAEAAADFYVSLLPGSRIVHIQLNAVDAPSGPKGSVLAVVFELAGQRFLAFNGGMTMEFTHAISLQIDCDDQAEVDRLWAAFTAEGRAEQCGWVRDRWGVAWQIVPKRLNALLMDPDPDRAGRALAAVLEMVKPDIAAIERAVDGG